MDFSSDEEALVVAALLEEEEEEEEQGEVERRTRIWVHDINLKRSTLGEHVTLFEDMLNDERKFFKNFRMSPKKFFELVDLMPSLQKRNTNYRQSIPPVERLAVTLKFLGHADSIFTLASSYRMGESTIRKIIHETCQLIWETLSPLVMPPITEEKWLNVAQKFDSVWNYPNCIGAIDGKHCVFEKPTNTGSLYFNYKKEFSVVLLALVDADYKFLTVDVGAYGRSSDGGTLRSSSLGQSLENNSLNIPPPKLLPGYDKVTSHVIVGDEAFPLKNFMMRPFPGTSVADDDRKKVYNYRHSRARRVSENAFGILAKKFRIYGRKFSIKPKYMDFIILATTALHNFLREDKCAWAPGEWEQDDSTDGLDDFVGIGGNNPRDAADIRDTFADYFMSDQGSVPWQWKSAYTSRKDQ